MAALFWSVFGLLWAQLLVLKSPVLPPPFFVKHLSEIPPATHPQRFVVMLSKETSLLLCAFALFGLLIAALARSTGARWSALVAAVFCVAAVVTSLVPVAQAWRTASSQGVPLSLSAYFSGPSSTSEHPSETVIYAHPNGEKLKLDVWQPSGQDGEGPGATQGQPAVIVVHGGGWHAGSRSEFPQWDSWLASKGYVVFDIDYRLVPPPRWQDAPNDVRCALAWVKENSDRYNVDPERVALMGRSAGAQLSLLAAYTEGTPTPSPGCEAHQVRNTGVAAVVAFYPPTDLVRLSTLGYLSGMGHYLGGSPGAFPGRYRLSSPVDHVRPSDPPTLLVHGGDDQIVPSGQSELLAKRLRQAGVSERLLELSWANHTFDFYWGGWSSQITRSALHDFLNNHLKPPPMKEGDHLSSPSGQLGAASRRARWVR